MLDPHERQLYTDALRPPPGHAFDRGVATTFTLDLTTLLTVPLSLTLFSSGRDLEEVLADPVGLLESLRQTAERLDVYCQQGMIQAPRGRYPLYSLLEPVVHEVRPPVHGIFHPKVWLLRYVRAMDGSRRMRLLVLTRNLTQDRSWDLSLQLEGEVGRTLHRENKPLAAMVERLPQMTATNHTPQSEPHVDLIEDLRRTEWEPPEPFREVRFHVLGLDGEGWEPPESDEALVISPFVSNRAIETIAERTKEPVALVSRLESLAHLDPATLELFDQVMHLHPDAGSEDPEVSSELLDTLTGLHAKAYAFKRGWNTHFFVGSANATDAGLEGANVEVLSELVGGWSQVGRPSELLDNSGLIEVLDEYERPEELPEPTDEEKVAARALEKVRKKLIHAGLRVSCRQDEEQWSMVLQAPDGLTWEGVKDVRVWPITLRRDSASHPIPGQWESNQLIEFSCAIASITGFFAFHLVTDQPGVELQFVLSLPLDGIPKEREGAILRSVLKDRERFVRYLLLLLGTFDDPWVVGKLAGGSSWVGRFGKDVTPLLEEMVRALCRDPERLVVAKRVVDRLLEDPQADEIIPPGFVDLWNVLQEEIAERVEA